MRRLPILMMLISCASVPERPADLPVLRPASPQVEALVRVAIGERYRAGDIPDQNLIQGKDTVFIFNEMETSAYLLSQASVPTSQATRFVLVGRTEARDLAYGSRLGLHLVQVDHIEIKEDRASLRIGVDVYPDPTSGGVRLCCCSARAQFGRKANTWEFVKWSDKICY